MQRNMYKVIMVVMGFLVFGGFTKTVMAGSCEVTAVEDDVNVVGSLRLALESHAREGTNSQQCADEIIIKENVNVNSTLVIENTANHQHLTISGDSSSSHKRFNSGITNNTPLFRISGAENVTIQDMDIYNSSDVFTARNGELSAPAAPFIHCEDAANLKLKNITVKNNPNTPLVFENCSGLEIDNLVIEANSTAAYIDDNANYHLNPYIKIQSSDNVTISKLTIKAGARAIDRDAIHIDGGVNLRIDNLIVEEADNQKATVLKMSDVEQLLSLQVEMRGVAGSAMQLNNVEGNLNSTYTIVELQGAYADLERVAASVTAANYPSRAGDAVIIKGNSRYLDFKLSGSITGFKRAGFVVEGNSDYISLTNGTILDNGTFGVVVKDEATNVSITNLLAKDNGNCGVALERAQTVQGVNYVNNGNNCALGVPASLQMPSSAVMLLATRANQAALDVSTSMIGSSTGLELHTFYATSSLLGLGGQFNSYASSLGLSGSRIHSKHTSSVEGMSAGENVRTSLQEYIAIPSGLPKTDLSIDTQNDKFMVILFNERDVITGVWQGDARNTGPGECIYRFSSGDCACVQGVTATEFIRTFDNNADTDGDGLLDHQELGGLCPASGSGSATDYTDPQNADTDNDGLTDYEERVSYVDEVNGNQRPNPLIADTDGDGIVDGNEDTRDANNNEGGDGDFSPNYETSAVVFDTDGDGLSDGAEVNGDGQYDPLFDTNPWLRDTDGDGMLDSADVHPLCDDTTGNCSYSDCVNIAAINDQVDGSFSESDVTINYNADDDGDGVPNRVEDINKNCVFEYSLGETNPLVPDTDADGCSDGQEDRNSNGIVDAGETNPLLPDTDGDLINDGVEVAGCVYVELNNDSSPLLIDTDGDGINDGDEDLNFNGVVDAGETNPSLIDTDNDGYLDSKWPVEIVVDENGVVKPAEEGRDLSPNYYSPANDVINFYCGVSNFDYIDTDGDSVADATETPSCRLNPTNPATASSLLADTDFDGLPDDLEFCYGASPYSEDTDGDGRSDYQEYSAGGKISLATLRSTCADGALQAQGATDGLQTTNSCSLNSNLQATSRGSQPITIIVAVLAVLLTLRYRRVMAS